MWFGRVRSGYSELTRRRRWLVGNAGFARLNGGGYYCWLVGHESRVPFGDEREGA